MELLTVKGLYYPINQVLHRLAHIFSHNTTPIFWPINSLILV